MKKKPNHFLIKELNEIFNLTFKLQNLIEVEKYSFDDILIERKKLYQISNNILNDSDINIEQYWHNFFNICLKYAYCKEKPLSSFINSDRYYSNNRNYDWIIYARNSENMKNNTLGEFVLLEDKDIFINLSILLSEDITQYSNVLNLLQIGFDYYDLDLKLILNSRIKEVVTQKNIKGLVFL